MAGVKSSDTERGNSKRVRLEGFARQLGVKVSISILGAEIDQFSPPALIKQFEETLNANPEVDVYVKIFPKVSHGWMVRYDIEDAEATKSADEAHENMLEWFAKYVK